MVDFWRKKVNSKKNFLSWVFTFYKKNLVEKNIYCSQICISVLLIIGKFLSTLKSIYIIYFPSSFCVLSILMLEQTMFELIFSTKAVQWFHWFECSRGNKYGPTASLHYVSDFIGIVRIFENFSIFFHKLDRISKFPVKKSHQKFCQNPSLGCPWSV